MKKFISMLTVVSFFLFVSGAGTIAHSQTQEIEAEAVAKELAANSGGVYVKGSTAPVVKETEVALPIIDESTGDIIGYIVADRDKLVSALNNAGLTKVAEALAAEKAGAVAGREVKKGLSGGTITLIALGSAAAIGLVVALVSSGGGGGDGGGGGTTPPPAH